MDRDSIEKLISDFWDRGVPDLTRRDIKFHEIKNKINVAIGIRRSGKTFLLFQKIKSLLDSGIKKTQILYINLEDERLLPLNARQLGEIIDNFYTLFPENHDQTCHIFLDEIQNVEEWPIVIRRVLDTKNISIYLSGSSAKLLSKEIATSLRGRALATEVWPFSFMEFLKDKNIQLPKNNKGSKFQDIIFKHLKVYLANGGFPETIALNSRERILVLQDYVNTVVYKDIIDRYKISNITLLKRLIKTLLALNGLPFSVNKCFNDFKSQGIKASKNTLYEYLSYIEDAYLVFSIPIFSDSIRKQQTNPRKLYAIDTGLVVANTLQKRNYAQLFENLIYLDLRRKGHEIYYYMTEENCEVDFITKDLKGKTHIYQVCWNMDHEKTAIRETRALRQAQKELNTKGQIITPGNYYQFINEENSS